MHLSAIRLRNFRRFRNACIDLDPTMSIFVGPNNSGKTSAAQAIKLFTGDTQEQFSVHDFSAACWPDFRPPADVATPGEFMRLPRMSLDLWLKVEAKDLHLVIDLLPRLDWKGSRVGIRIEFGPKDEAELLQRFSAAESQSKENRRPARDGAKEYRPWPQNLMDYLLETLSSEYTRRYFVLDDAHFNNDLEQAVDYVPLALVDAIEAEPGERKRGGLQILQSLIRIDCLDAQRHLSDSSAGARTEHLSTRLSRFYTRNLSQRPSDYEALRALEESKDRLDEHLAKEFSGMLTRLRGLVYPGLASPRLKIRASLGVSQIFGKDGASVHYELDGPAVNGQPPTLPDRYNGLGFKNLIYMAVELFDYHAQWLGTEDTRPPLHLVLIEEPEAHLHAQLQQVFVREVAKLVPLDGDNAGHCSTQLIVTTHSTHITFERGFSPIRYFRRGRGALVNESVVLNISAFYEKTPKPEQDFLRRYMRLTHCDIFFADAAVLVEGTVERMLLPSMVEKCDGDLKSAYLSILEVGGAFGHRFKALIEFIGIPTLLVTDLDSVDTQKRACSVHTPGATTSNQVLIQWLPKKASMDELLAATVTDQTLEPSEQSQAPVRVVHQQLVQVSWNKKTELLAGRTFEEAFALQNMQWCQDASRKALGLNITDAATMSPGELAAKLHERVHSASFGKVDFALGVLAEDPATWNAPKYIHDGLSWLASKLMAIALLADSQPLPSSAAAS